MKSMEHITRTRVSYKVFFPPGLQQLANGSRYVSIIKLLIYNYSNDKFSIIQLQVHPEGMGDVLRKIKNDYGNPRVFIFENGYSDDGSLNDYGRINYYYSYLKELLLAVNRDKCRVERYSVWSLMDNFEWARGYTYVSH